METNMNIQLVKIQSNLGFNAQDNVDLSIINAIYTLKEKEEIQKWYKENAELKKNIRMDYIMLWNFCHLFGNQLICG